jgi:IS5 family transposase
MGRSELALARLVEIAEAFCTRHPSPRGRGRPPTYSEGLVLALWALGQLHGLSWRKLESISRQLLPRVPDFSTLHYRVRRLPQERWEEFNRWLAQRALAGDEPELLLVDGTGWGFGLPYWACWRRGEELRRLRSHVDFFPEIPTLVSDWRPTRPARLNEEGRGSHGWTVAKPTRQSVASFHR